MQASLREGQAGQASSRHTRVCTEASAARALLLLSAWPARRLPAGSLTVHPLHRTPQGAPPLSFRLTAAACLIPGWPAGWNACASCYGDTSRSRKYLVLPGLKSGRVYGEAAPALASFWGLQVCLTATGACNTDQRCARPYRATQAQHTVWWWGAPSPAHVLPALPSLNCAGFDVLTDPRKPKLEKIVEPEEIQV